jgi:hypothetical protein
MAKLIMWNLMTLDGFIEGKNRDISWHLDVWGLFNSRPHSTGIVILRYEPAK